MKLVEVKLVEVKLEEALEMAKQVRHSDMLQYLIEVALIEVREDYYRRLPLGHPDKQPPLPGAS